MKEYVKDDLTKEFLLELFARLEAKACLYSAKGETKAFYNSALLKTYNLFLEYPNLNELYYNSPAHLKNKDILDNYYRFFSSFNSQEERSLYMIKHIGGMF